jgi:hypothetical protein
MAGLHCMLPAASCCCCCCCFASCHMSNIEKGMCGSNALIPPCQVLLSVFSASSPADCLACCGLSICGQPYACCPAAARLPAVPAAACLRVVHKHTAVAAAAHLRLVRRHTVCIPIYPCRILFGLFLVVHLWAGVRLLSCCCMLKTHRMFNVQQQEQQTYTTPYRRRPAESQAACSLIIDKHLYNKNYICILLFYGFYFTLYCFIIMCFIIMCFKLY